MNKKNFFQNLFRGFFGIEYVEENVSPITINQEKVVFREPSSFNDAKFLADDIKAGKLVVINLDGLDKDIARRIVDFSTGFIYILGGKMKSIGEMIFLLTPNNSIFEEKEA